MSEGKFLKLQDPSRRANYANKLRAPPPARGVYGLQIMLPPKGT
ncbi:hypothetical protein HBZC1_16940 [Helicobacter bizzozeronii CIII-1]|uniref:Uncharacterized protein n=1 Tax=Helicobacter bizzozeronii (strain CIII-1) TaxID=1002804 RepID=F8KPF6_HELBC|nr:hypothetical protein HBZC1_16940 [Helicobacter bizzozeronii CIII-1]